MNVQAKVAIAKQKHPEFYCPHPRCLWRVMVCHPMTREMVPARNCENGRCPRHRVSVASTTDLNAANSASTLRAH